MVQRLVSSNRYLFSIASSFFFFESSSGPKYRMILVPFLIRLVAKRPSPVGERPIREGFFDEISGMMKGNYTAMKQRTERQKVLGRFHANVRPFATLATTFPRIG